MALNGFISMYSAPVALWEKIPINQTLKLGHLKCLHFSCFWGKKSRKTTHVHHGEPFSKTTWIGSHLMTKMTLFRQDAQKRTANNYFSLNYTPIWGPSQPFVNSVLSFTKVNMYR